MRSDVDVHVGACDDVYVPAHDFDGDAVHAVVAVDDAGGNAGCEYVYACADVTDDAGYDCYALCVILLLMVWLAMILPLMMRLQRVVLVCLLLASMLRSIALW